MHWPSLLRHASLYDVMFSAAFNEAHKKEPRTVVSDNGRKYFKSQTRQIARLFGQGPQNVHQHHLRSVSPGDLFAPSEGQKLAERVRERLRGILDIPSLFECVRSSKTNLKRYPEVALKIKKIVVSCHPLMMVSWCSMGWWTETFIKKFIKMFIHNLHFRVMYMNYHLWYYS